MNIKNLFLYYRTMSEDDFYRFIKQIEKEVWEDNFPEYKKENNNDE